jgi:hypothetical protein
VALYVFTSLCRTFPEGIQYNNMEIFELYLGPVKDFVYINGTLPYVVHCLLSE